MDDTQQVHSSAQTTEAPSVKPKHPGGRKPKGYYERGVQDRLNGLAPDAVIILDHHIHQRKGYKTIKDSVYRQSPAKDRTFRRGPDIFRAGEERRSPGEKAQGSISRCRRDSPQISARDSGQD